MLSHVLCEYRKISYEHPIYKHGRLSQHDSICRDKTKSYMVESTQCKINIHLEPSRGLRHMVTNFSLMEEHMPVHFLLHLLPSDLRSLL